MVAEDVANSVGSLMLWKFDHERAFKRSRIGVACKALSEIPIAVNNAFLLQDEYRQITSSSAVCLLEGHAKRRHLLYKGEPADIRSQRFERERKKFALLLSNCIKEANLPVVSQISLLDDPHEGWLRILATRRANTLKSGYKTWKPFRDWLEQHRGRVYPLGTKDAVDYLQFRVNEGCGKTLPESLSCAIHLMGQVGKVPESERISKDLVWDAFGPGHRSSLRTLNRGRWRQCIQLPCAFHLSALWMMFFIHCTPGPWLGLSLLCFGAP